MVTKHNLDCFDAFTARFIRSKVNKLIGRAGFQEADRHDLLQDFVLDLLQRREKFDSEAANWEAFVVVVCENCCATILEHRQAEMRSPDQEGGSLNRPVKDAEGNRTEFGATLSDSAQGHRTRQYRRTHEEASDLIHDVAHLLAQLPPQLRSIAERLQRMSKEEVARELGVSSKTIYRRVAEIRERFEQAGLRAYL